MRLSSIPRPVAASGAYFQLRSLPSVGVTRLHRYYEPLRHLTQPGLFLTKHRLTFQLPRRLPVLRCFPLPACRRHYPGRSSGALSLVFLHCLRPSLGTRQVGSCITRFGACSAFIFITACTLAKSPKRPSSSKGSDSFINFHCRFDCYRAERSSSRVGTFTPL